MVSRTRRWLSRAALSMALLGPVSGAFAAESHEFTLALQNGRDYASATDSGQGPELKLSLDRNAQKADAYVLRFGDLGDYIRGDDVRITDAHLELYYADETWTLIRYHVAAFRSLDGSATNLAPEADGRVTIAGDKWPAGVRTPLKSWVSIPIRPETVTAWLKDERANKGIVLTIDSAEVGPEQVHVDLHPSSEPVRGAFVAFRSDQGAASERPRLVVHYRVLGNAPPPAPELAAAAPGTLLASPVSLRWDKVQDPDAGDTVRYQFQAGFQSGGRVSWPEPVVTLDAPSLQWNIATDRDRLYPVAGTASGGRPLWYRVRAVDEHGASSRWQTAGPYQVTDQAWSVWALDGDRKVWGASPVPAAVPHVIRIHAARNEWEPFQVAVAAHAALTDMRVTVSPLSGPGGARLVPPTVYREHYIPIEETANATYGHLGMVPDALVPLVNPMSGRPTGGKYGGDHFDVSPGRREVFWFDNYVPAGTAPGIYRGTVTVSARGMTPVQVQVELEVWNFTLPSPKHLVACFQLDEGSVAQSHQLKPNIAGAQAIRRLTERYEQMLHEHYISNWSPITGINYGLNGVKVTVHGNVVTTDWSEFDALVGPYMDGSAFADKVPSQCLFAPYWLPTPKKDGSGWAPRVNQFNYQNVRYDLFGQFVRQMQEHFEKKGWLDRAYVFYFDEPFISQWKYEAFVNTAKVIRREAPKLKIMLSDGYRGADGYKDKRFITEPIDKYVDVWDPVTFQVSSPELAEYYRARNRAGKFDFWCETLANANPNRAIINLFPEYDMPFHRMWGVLSWSLGFRGLEWWQTIVWWDPNHRRRIDPWTEAKAFPGFNQPLNGDGRLFYPGTSDAIGGPDIPVSTLRMKAIREAIEDYEYLYLLRQSGAEARFPLDRLHTFDKTLAAKMREPMPMGKGPWQWWEGDPDAFMQVRAEIARLIVEAQAHGRRTGP